jgi:hypothetical protein
MLSANGCTTIVGIVRALTSCGNAVVVLVDVVVVAIVVAGATVVDVKVADVVGRVVVAFVVVGATVVEVVGVTVVVVVVEVVVVVVVVVVTGVIEVDANAATPVLTALSALTRNEYNVSFTRPVTVALSDVDTPSLNTDHTPELCTEYSTT